MKNRTFLLSFSLFALFFTSPQVFAQNFGWAKPLDGFINDIHVAVDPSGNVYSTGYFSGSFDADHGPGVEILTAAGYDIFLIKTDPMGNMLWAKSFGGINNSTTIPEAIILDKNANIYLSGYFNKTMQLTVSGNATPIEAIGIFDAFVMQLDSSGNINWVNNYGSAWTGVSSGASAHGRDLVVDQNANVYVIGDFWGIIDFDKGAGVSNWGNEGRQSSFILKLNSSGNLIWAKAVVSRGNIFGWRICVDPSANVYFVAQHGDTADYNPGPGQELVIPGNTGYRSNICKFDNSGNFVWVKDVANYCNQIMIGANGVYVSGDGELSLFDAQGNLSWKKNIAPHFNMTQDKFGDIYTYGNFNGTYDFDPGSGQSMLTNHDSSDIFIQKMDQSGNFIWVKRIASPGNYQAFQYITGLCVDPDLNIYASGSFKGETDFNPESGTFKIPDSPQNYRYFLLKLDNSINLQSLVQAKHKQNAKAYPNPSAGQVNFQLEEFFPVLGIQVYDLSGRKVAEKEIQATNNYQADLSELPNGMYTILIQNEGTPISVLKFVKQN